MRWSIQWKINIVPVIVITVILSAFGFHNYRTLRTRLDRELTRTGEAISRRMARTLVSALWNVNEDIAEEVIRFEMQDESVNAVFVWEKEAEEPFFGMRRDGKNEAVYSKTPPDRPHSGENTVYEKKIVKDEDELGFVQIRLNTEIAEKELFHALREISVWICILDICILFVMFFFIRRIVIRPVSEVAKELGDHAEQVSGAAVRMSAVSHEHAEKTVRQTSLIDEMFSFLKEILSMSEKNAGQAMQTDQLVKKDAGKKLERAFASMRRLTLFMEEIIASSRKTSEIIHHINAISFQTNLLALNAAVEASNAGKAGSGFAVVAAEVRNLAVQSRDAARMTEELIESTRGKLADMSEILKETDLSFQEVGEVNLHVLDLVEKIAGASREQRYRIEQITRNCEQIDRVVYQAVEKAYESAENAKNMNALAEEMKDVVHHLKKLMGQ